MAKRKTFGTITFKNGYAIVQCAAHVAIKFTQVFRKATRLKAGVFQIRATSETGYDLSWFRQRYPLQCDGKHAEQLAALVGKFEDRLEAIAEIDASGYVPPMFDLAIPPREYQRTAAGLVHVSGRLLVADELGTGKTVSGICTLLLPDALPAIVVTQTHLTRQWEAEIRRFAPKLRTHRVRITTPYSFAEPRIEIGADKKRRVVKGPAMPDVVLMAYSQLNGWADELGGKVKTVIFDEMQELRRHDSLKRRAAIAISEDATRRVGLSVGPDTRVEMRGGPFGSGWSGRIDLAWEMIAACSARRDTADGYDICAPVGVMSRGFGDAGFCWKSVTSAIRHHATKPMRSLKAGGVRTDLTIDHSVFVVGANGIEHKRTDELTTDDVIPVDDGKAWTLSTELPCNVTAIAARVSRAQIVVDLSNVNRTQIGLKAWEWQNCHREATYGPRVPIGVYLRHPWLKVVGPVYVGRGKAAALPASLKLSSWAYVLGFFLGDGWVEGGRACFAVDQPRVTGFISRLNKLGIGLRPEIRKARGESSEVRVSHILFARVLSKIVGAPCHAKRIPAEWIFTWSENARLQLLDGLIDSDGHRGKRKPASRAYTTTSEGLADDVRLLLRSLGMKSGIHRQSPAIGGTVQGRTIVGRRDRFQVSWSEKTREDGDPWLRLMNGAPVREVAPVAVSAKSYVYDLEMDGHPSFVGNGLLCHNTATPVYNYGDEIHSVVSVLDPDALGDHSEFIKEWCSGPKNAVEDPRALGIYLRESGIMIRRTRKDIGREIPELTVIRQVVDSDPDVITKAEESVAELARRILARTGSAMDQMRDAGEIDWRMRQATGIAKAPAVIELVRLLLDSGTDRLMLFGWHRAVFDIYSAMLTKAGITFVMFTGHETSVQKARSVETFKDGGARVFMMSNRSGAGIDGLQHACHVGVVGELDWSPKVHDQGVGRFHRDGQLEKASVYYAVAEGGSDPVIEDVLGIKAMQAAGIERPHDDAPIPVPEVDVDRIKKLAETILRQKRQAIGLGVVD